MPAHRIGNSKFIGKQEEAWIDGYIFSNLEKRYLKAIKDKEDSFRMEIDIPKSWFGLQATTSESVTLDPTAINRYVTEMEDMATVLCRRWRVLESKIYPNMQYMRVCLLMDRAIPRLTKSQIEKLLGYEIEIIQER